MSPPSVRKRDPCVPLTKAAFRERFFARFYDPAFEQVTTELERVFEVAWDGYQVYRKSPRQVPAGADFADPVQPLPVEWLATRRAIADAEVRHRDSLAPSRFLIVNGSTRSEHTCPGEISKTRRLVDAARAAIEALPNHQVDVLDLSTLADEP